MSTEQQTSGEQISNADTSSAYMPISSGDSKSTNIGYKSALNQFQTFLKSSGHIINEDEWETLSVEMLCSSTLLSQFGTYLVHHAKDQKGLPLQPGTCSQYLSGLKT